MEGSDVTSAPAAPGTRIVTIHDDANWIGENGIRFDALFFGQRNDAASPVGVFLKADRNVADRIAGERIHATTVMLAVVTGSAQIDGQWFLPGEMQVVAPGVPHGDLVVGPEGATLLMLFAQRSGLPPQFTEADDQDRFAPLRSAVERAAAGVDETPFVLLPPRPTHRPRRGVGIAARAEAEARMDQGRTGGPVPAGMIRTSFDDDGLPWGPAVLNARTAWVVLGDVEDPTTPTVGVIDVAPGPGDRLRARHIHKADAINLVIHGAMYMDGVWLRPGESKVVDANYEYGDALTGPEGVRFLEIWSTQSGAEPQFSDEVDQRYFEDLKARGHLLERESVR